jgi:hypothetical protein
VVTILELFGYRTHFYLLVFFEMSDLAAQTKTGNQGAVALHVFAFQVVQKLAAGIYHPHQTLAGVVVLLVFCEMLSELFDIGG